mgnify:CR=1 FL=1
MYNSEGSTTKETYIKFKQVGRTPHKYVVFFYGFREPLSTFEGKR